MLPEMAERFCSSRLEPEKFGREPCLNQAAHIGS
ncbi:MAG: hypothetical protein JWL90_287 [Chthoniobacteraceae bacterium]|nr:hypothetical protein [Chthoniobacteraceae bacterium]